jgi:hypothetical protein
MTSIFEIADDGIRQAETLRSEGEGADSTLIWHYELDDGRAVDVYVMLFSNARLCVGPPGWLVYDEGYCYSSPAGALLAAAKYVHAGGQGEPEGWIKNLQTQEYRS